MASAKQLPPSLVDHTPLGERSMPVQRVMADIAADRVTLVWHSQRSLIPVTLAGLVLLSSAACGNDSSIAGASGDGGSGGISFVSASAGTGGNGGAGASGAGGAGGSAAGAAQSTTAGMTSAGSGGSGLGGSTGAGQGGTGGPCEFPQGVPDSEYIATAPSYQDTDPAVDADVNAVMTALTGCGVSSDCPITGFPGTTVEEICQSWFAAVTQELRAQGYCAGQHVVGSTDEIAVSNTGCEGKWYGYHICFYGGPKVVWNPGARRGWWMINPSYCTP